MRINDLSPEIKVFLYKRCCEQIQSSNISADSLEFSMFHNDFEYAVDISPKTIHFDYDKYAPNIQACLDKARQKTEHHWNIKIEWS